MFGEFDEFDNLLLFDGILSSLLTRDQPDRYFMGLLGQGTRSLAACERIFYDWGAAIAWRKRQARRPAA